MIAAILQSLRGWYLRTRKTGIWTQNLWIQNRRLYHLAITPLWMPKIFLKLTLGRFREFYYWDTYWIVKALLHCDMSTTVKGIIENFLSMVRTHGIVPNGGRIYYLKRSQPPFLTLMVKVRGILLSLGDKGLRMELLMIWIPSHPNSNVDTCPIQFSKLRTMVKFN